ncbi:flagellar biosynthesis anti-sigma factor FlgM [Syntrophorhabdus aromaticivorans]|uniref:Negative regulator of flagellin synthesis n=1 Tax=Syntrophorhabdus aromaticivorans TaxID=328301 RepID=A0A971M431_9BACT|nr:flagellar biosynthesis anti-sigma factor FlgM [Syntrophorhabdus aromaticivorans]NLW35653.1 flagellar biosynthesis anti-sigma factor FlgM [Syntrophorhabdus aromaticivorans]
MKVMNDSKPTLIENLVKSNNVKASQGADVQGKKSGDMADKVELTGRKDEIDRVREKVNATPVVREEKVASLRQAVQTETYNIRGELVAKSLLKSHLLDEIL